MFAPEKKSYDQPRQHIKKQRHYFANKDPSSQGYGFSMGEFCIKLAQKQNLFGDRRIKLRVRRDINQDVELVILIQFI